MQNTGAPGEEMEVLKHHNEAPEESRAEAVAWQPEVLAGAAEACDLPADFDLSEVWYWLHSRLRALGELSHDDARLTALLNWNEITVADAVHAARLQNQSADGEEQAVQVHLEFLTAEYLARQVLEDDTIPTPELHPA